MVELLESMEKIRKEATAMWQCAQENTVVSPKTDTLWWLSNSEVSSCR
jgi:hypothetical protein